MGEGVRMPSRRNVFLLFCVSSARANRVGAGRFSLICARAFPSIFALCGALDGAKPAAARACGRRQPASCPKGWDWVRHPVANGLHEGWTAFFSARARGRQLERILRRSPPSPSAAALRTQPCSHPRPPRPTQTQRTVQGRPVPPVPPARLDAVRVCAPARESAAARPAQGRLRRHRLPGLPQGGRVRRGRGLPAGARRV
jgi:hypothetical protein